MYSKKAGITHMYNCRILSCKNDGTLILLQHDLCLLMQHETFVLQCKAGMLDG